MGKVNAAQAGDRARRYLDALQDAAPIWEVGNEVNGDWVGDDAVDKIDAMFDTAKAYGKRTALTFYYRTPATRGQGTIGALQAAMDGRGRLAHMRGRMIANARRPKCREGFRALAQERGP